MPFTTTQFFRGMAQYNATVWPMQVVLVAIALYVLARPSSRNVGRVLAFLWAWMGIGYHLVFFARINPAAWIFGVAFLAASVLFLRESWKGSLELERPRGLEGVVGGALVAYALVFYPLIGILTGEPYPETPTFGLPCPTTIFTLGVLTLTRRRAPLVLYVVPLLWAVIGTSAAAMLGVVEDLGLAVAGCLAIVVRLDARGHFIRRLVVLVVLASMPALAGCSLIGAGIGSAVPRYEGRRQARELHLDDEIRVMLLKSRDAADVLPREGSNHVDGRYAGTHEGSLLVIVDGQAEPREIALTEIEEVRVRVGTHWATGLAVGAVVDVAVVTVAVAAAESVRNMQLDVGSFR